MQTPSVASVARRKAGRSMGMDVGSLETEAPVSTTLPAAKLHLLQLEPIKAQLGERWPRMSVLVHSLFEKALHRAKGPSDHFVKLDELSYVATFHGSSPEEAAPSAPVSRARSASTCSAKAWKPPRSEAWSARSRLKSCAPRATARHSPICWNRPASRSMSSTKGEAGLQTSEQRAGSQVDANSPGPCGDAKRTSSSEQAGRELRLFPAYGT